jgi:hypothetical protein
VKYARRRSDFAIGDVRTAMYDVKVIELVTRCILHKTISAYVYLFLVTEENSQCKVSVIEFPVAPSAHGI